MNGTIVVSFYLVALFRFIVFGIFYGLINEVVCVY